MPGTLRIYKNRFKFIENTLYTLYIPHAEYDPYANLLHFRTTVKL